MILKPAISAHSKSCSTYRTSANLENYDQLMIKLTAVDLRHALAETIAEKQRQIVLQNAYSCTFQVTFAFYSEPYRAASKPLFTKE